MARSYPGSVRGDWRQNSIHNGPCPDCHGTAAIRAEKGTLSELLGFLEDARKCLDGHPAADDHENQSSELGANFVWPGVSSTTSRLGIANRCPFSR